VNATRRSLAIRSLCALVALSGVLLLAHAALSAQEPGVFQGRTVEESSPPTWPPLARPPDGAPNVILILVDDVGYGASSTFGGPVPTPTLDALAAKGLVYTRFHNTAMCSPTRAALLTGRNHTTVNMGNINGNATGYAGHNAIMPKAAGTIARILQRAGYNTAAYGKWHLTPPWAQGPNGPFDQWPLGMGFDRFYGFLDGDTDQYAPALYRDNTPIEPPAGDPTYTVDRGAADEIIGWIQATKSVAPDKPFFVYFAPGAAHAPHHAPAEWLERFRGRFDMGWDAMRDQILARQKELGIVPENTVLTARPEPIAAWDSLTGDERLVHSRLMEAFAGNLAYFDHQVGRIVETLEDMGQLDNTLILYLMGDNGGSAESGLDGAITENAPLNGIDVPVEQMLEHVDEIGTRDALNNFPAGWGHATNTPFQWMKQIGSHWGGTRSGMVISWPERIQSPGIRPQFHHVIDVAPTVLEAARLSIPETLDGVDQIPMDGISMGYTFDDAQAESRRRTQFFMMWDNLAIYHDGWVAATVPHVYPWDLLSTAPGRVEDREWELYAPDDFSQARNVADESPEKLRQLKELFWAEAARHNALPIHRGEGRAGRPSWTAGRSHFIFLPGTVRIPTAQAPNTLNRSYTIAADVDVPAAGASGVLVTHGGRHGGFGLYVLNGRLVYHYNLADAARYEVVSTRPLSPGAHRLEARFDYDGGAIGNGATVTLLEDGVEIGSGRIARTMTRFYTIDAQFDVGEDTGSPVSEDYTVPFRNDGLRRLEITLR
jgi:arylsulfatase